MRKPKLFRFVDWKLWFSVGFVLLVFLAVSVFNDRTHEVDVRNQQINHLIAQVQQQDQDAAEDRQAAAENQRLLLTYTSALATQQRALITYLRVHGIKIPEKFIVQIQPPVLTPLPSSSTSNGKGNTKSPKVSTPGKGKGRGNGNSKKSKALAIIAQEYK